jgi:hypothetical protein
MQQTIKIIYHDKQIQAYEQLQSPAIRRVLYGGAKGGGKSWFLCTWAFDYALRVVREHGLKPSKNPPHVGWMGRKQAVDFTGTTLQTWREIIPEDAYEIRGGTERDPKHILLYGTVAIDFGGLDRQEHVNKFNSAEYGFIAVDQAEEVTRDDVSVLRGSLRMKVKGRPLPYKELYTANPRNCWLREEFILNPEPDSVFVSALPSDNPELPPDYQQTLISAFGYRPELLRAYLEGDWSVIEGADQVILDNWLARAITAKGMYQGKILACDPARFGDDKTEIMLLDGTQIVHSESMAYSRTTDISDRLDRLSRDNGNCSTVVDEIGVGGGVVDELHRYGRRVISFNSAGRSTDEQYYNLRAEAWWEVAQDFAATNIGCNRMDADLRRDLCCPTYEFRNGKILIESKDKIKERLHRSPDKGDCYVMGIWGLKRLSAEPYITSLGFPGEHDRVQHYEIDPLRADKL